MWTRFVLHHAWSSVQHKTDFKGHSFCPAQRMNFFWASPYLIVFKKESTSRGSPRHLAESKSQEIAPFPSNPAEVCPSSQTSGCHRCKTKTNGRRHGRATPKSAHIVTTRAEGAGKDVLPQKLLRRSLFIWTLTFSSEFKDCFLYLDCADNSLSTRHQHMCNLSTTPHARDFHITGMLLRS